MNNLNELLSSAPFFSLDRNYWLVRTSSGDYYADFIKKNYIAIGWNEIKLSDLDQLRKDPNNLVLIETIKNKIKTNLDALEFDEDINDESNNRGISSRKSRALGQMLKFANDIKAGDIVVIPSESSNLLSFGEVVETPLYIASGEELEKCNFIKRKKVIWIKKDINRLKLDSNLYKFIFAHQTINKVTEYGEYINSTLYDFYISGDKASLVLRLRKTEGFDPFELGDFYNDLINFIKEFSEFNDERIQYGDMEVKFNLHSPGTIIFIGGAFLTLAVIGILTNLAGGEQNLNIDPLTGKIKTKFKSNSFLDKYSDFLDRKQNRKFNEIRFLNSLNKLDVAPNEELKSLTEGKSDDLTDNTIKRLID
jgi:restriction system protein